MTPTQLELLERHGQQVVQRGPGWIVFGDLDQRRVLIKEDDCAGSSNRPGADLRPQRHHVVLLDHVLRRGHRLFHSRDDVRGDQSRRIPVPPDLPGSQDIRDPVGPIAKSAQLHDDLAVEAVRARSPDARDSRRAHAGEKSVGYELQIVLCNSERVRERLRLSPWMPRLQRVLSELFVDAVRPLGIRQQLAGLGWPGHAADRASSRGRPPVGRPGQSGSVFVVRAEDVFELGDHPRPAHRPAPRIRQLTDIDSSRDVRVAVTE